MQVSARVDPDCLQAEVKTDGEGAEGELRVTLGTREEEEEEVKPGAALYHHFVG